MMRSFDEIKDLIQSDPWKPESIGTASEQSVHRAIKYWISTDPTTHEVRIDGRIADVFVDGRVYEIQTRSFGAIRDKVRTLLVHHPVTIVYPVVRRRTVYAIGIDGAVGRGHVLPRRKRVAAILAELPGLGDLVGAPGLDFLVVAFDASEYRTATFAKAGKRTGRIDIYPGGMPETHRFADLRSFMTLIPETLPRPFTVKDLAKALGMSAADAGRAAVFLRTNGLVRIVGKTGNANQYETISVTM
jgi:hypothetical protein